MGRNANGAVSWPFLPEAAPTLIRSVASVPRSLMTQASDVTSPTLRAAEEAAGRGDFNAAERLLRDALASQEASLGKTHPDVANIVNNLAVVYERLGRVAEAEQSYRRAHAIAVASLPPKHPFVATSLKNLVEFCKAHGVPIWRPPARVGDDAAATPLPTASPAPTVVPDIALDPSDDAAAAGSPVRSWRVAALVVLAVSLALVVYATVWHGSDEPPASGEVAGVPAPANPAPPDVPSIQPGASESRPAAPPRSAAPAPESGARSASVTVLAAAVCTSLERRGSPDWECARIDGSSPPAKLTFYTRLAAPAATAVEHRWYFAGKLHRTIRLTVPASRAGYRTYSQIAVASDRTGDWRVEVRDATGALLQEERFVVR